MRRTSAVAVVLALTSVVGSPSWAGTDWERKLRVAADVLLELEDLPEGELPADLIEDANCIAVIPYLVKGAFWLGGKHGRGLISCRVQEEGQASWSPPVAVRVSGLSVGAQFGGQVTDLVLFFLSQRGVESLLKNRITLGADVSVAAGPVGRSAEAATDLRFKAEIYAYAKSRGLFVGVSLEGARLGIADKGNRQLYEAQLEPAQVLFEGVEPPKRPTDLQAFLDALPE